MMEMDSDAAAADPVATCDGDALLRAMRQWTREQIGAFKAGLAARRRAPAVLRRSIMRNGGSAGTSAPPISPYPIADRMCGFRGEAWAVTFVLAIVKVIAYW
jgi:hypothetical protein